MTHKEFTDRVKMTVSMDEFASINEVYMNSDLDKDAFCRIWVKMNKSRVLKARAEQAELREKQILREMAWTLYQQISRIEDAHLKDAEATLNHAQKNLLRGLNIGFEYRSLTSVWYDLHLMFGVA